MNSILENTRQTLDGLNLMDREARRFNHELSPAKVSTFIPEPEPDDNVRIVRALNQLFDAIGDKELSAEAWRELHNLRSDKEVKAIQAVKSRCEVDHTEGPMGTRSHEARDPISKVWFNVGYTEDDHMKEPKKWAKENLAQEVVMMR